VTFKPSHAERERDLTDIIDIAHRALVLSASLDAAVESASAVASTSSAPSSEAAPPVSAAFIGDFLVRGVAHDLNNMLLVIQNSAESLRQNASGLVEREAAMVQDAVTQATRLVAKLLPTEAASIRPAGLDLSDAVERFSAILGSLAGDKVRVVTELAADLPLVLADETAILRVLSNLATNGRDAMPEGGTLTLATRAATAGSVTAGGTPRSYVLLTVADTGAGMDAATRDRALEPFFTTKSRGKGSGVGLTAVRVIVENMGGHLLIQSEPGRGTTVSVYLEPA
jgi:signal transduction histidine kinase